MCFVQSQYKDGGLRLVAMLAGRAGLAMLVGWLGLAGWAAEGQRPPAAPRQAKVANFGRSWELGITARTPPVQALFGE